MKSYFFIPGDNLRFIEKSKDLDASCFVYDLEDAVATKNKFLALDNLLKLETNPSRHYVRLAIKEKVYSNYQLASIIAHFHGNIVVPKIDTAEEISFLQEIVEKDFSLNLILLIETPQGIINAQDIIEKHMSSIKGISLGSHDFSSNMRMKHTLENLDFYKKQLLLLAKAYELEFIDSVDFNIQNFEHFTIESIQAFNSGADAKFIIHPKQLETFNNLEFYSDEELRLYKKVYDKLSEINERDLDILTVEGKIFEKPHLKSIKRVFEKKNRYESK